MKADFLKALLIAGSVSLVACQSDNEAEVKLEDTASAKMEISEEVMNNIIQSIPSPLELSSALKFSGAQYDNGILNATEHLESYSTANKKAFNLGVYGADLAYINIYEMNMHALNYLNAIKRLADDLKIGHFFDVTTMRRLSENKKNIDSLLYVSTTNFNKMDEYLRENKRGNLSVLMIGGAWLEGLYIATQIYKTHPNEEIKNNIAQQKVVLDNIMIVVNAYKSVPYFAELGKELETVKSQYDKIKITTEYRQPVSKEVNGKLVIEDNSKTSIDIPAGAIESLTTAIAEVRNKRIK
jgi:hypothetical protein